jgi:hypothetical protein
MIYNFSLFLIQCCFTITRNATLMVTRFIKTIIQTSGQGYQEAAGNYFMRLFKNFSQYIIRVIKSMRMKWVRHIERIGKKSSFEILERKRPLGRLRHRWNSSITINLQNRLGNCRLDSTGSRLRRLAGFYEYCNEPSIKCWEFIESLGTICF